jgi:hypothetical protein
LHEVEERIAEVGEELEHESQSAACFGNSSSY